EPKDPTAEAMPTAYPSTARLHQPPLASRALSDTFASAAPVHSYRYLGQVKASYLVCEDSDGILFVDQHALHEKIQVEKLKAEVAAGRVPFQRLLVPKVVPLAADKIALVEMHQKSLEAVGLE